MTEDERGPFPLRIIDINDTQALLKEAVNTSGEATSSEEKMLIEMDGVSVTAKPRKDGRYQGYVLQNGKKKYLYGKSPEEVKNKIKVFLRTQENAPQRKKREPKKSPLFGDYAANWALTPFQGHFRALDKKRAPTSCKNVGDIQDIGVLVHLQGLEPGTH